MLMNREREGGGAEISKFCSRSRAQSHLYSGSEVREGAIKTRSVPSPLSFDTHGVFISAL